jgi:hypothetical protein
LSTGKGNGAFDLLARNHELFGILLGFGKYNSHLFQRREDLDPYELPINLRIKVPPSPEYTSIQSELEDLSQKMCCFNGYSQCFPIVTFNQVTFAADPNHPETIFLRKKYEAQRKRIHQILDREDWFEQILLQLTSE